ncbi:hypothetical protein AB4Z09_27265 [Rhodococcus sp. TAF43]|uniref:hypothetical protein n=1 Tax=Rhodococcus sp. TAF43 TaxID=3237483 RepID=UPI003F960E48
MMSAESPCYVYVLRRNDNQRIVYVGIGDNYKRAVDPHGDNPALAKLIMAGKIATETMRCPNRVTAEAVEAAMISALSIPGSFNLLNRIAGHGDGFTPLGVPSAAAGRRLVDPASLPEIGREAGGILIVRTGETRFVHDTRSPIDPTNIDDRVVAAAVRGVWQIPQHTIDNWAAGTPDRPRILAGLSGPKHDRYICAAMEIDHTGWGRVTTGDSLKTIPLVGELPLAHTLEGEGDSTAADLTGVDVDAAQLRGRRISADVTFSSVPSGYWIWVGPDGTVHFHQPHHSRR